MLLVGVLSILSIRFEKGITVPDELKALVENFQFYRLDSIETLGYRKARELLELSILSIRFPPGTPVRPS